jgi:hypothetical protein
MLCNMFPNQNYVRISRSSMKICIKFIVISLNNDGNNNNNFMCCLFNDVITIQR